MPTQTGVTKFATYVEGDTFPAIERTLYDDNGNPIDLTLATHVTFSAAFTFPRGSYYTSPRNQIITEALAQIITPTLGLVRYTPRHKGDKAYPEFVDTVPGAGYSWGDNTILLDKDDMSPPGEYLFRWKIYTYDSSGTTDAEELPAGIRTSHSPNLGFETLKISAPVGGREYLAAYPSS